MFKIQVEIACLLLALRRVKADKPLMKGNFSLVAYFSAGIGVALSVVMLIWSTTGHSAFFGAVALVVLAFASLVLQLGEGAPLKPVKSVSERKHWQ